MRRYRQPTDERTEAWADEAARDRDAQDEARRTAVLMREDCGRCGGPVVLTLAAHDAAKGRYRCAACDHAA